MVSLLKPKGRRGLVKSRHGWEDNIKKNLQDYDGGHGQD
jgi:hypothetical protein